MAVDESRLNAFLGQFAQDLGATVQAGMVLGHRLGLSGPWPGPAYLPGALQLAPRAAETPFNVVYEVRP